MTISPSRKTRRFLNSCTMVATCLMLAAFVSAVAISVNIQLAGIPELLGNNPESIARVKTATDPNDFTFIVIGDVKSGTATFEAMLDTIHPDKPAFAVVLGDFVDRYQLISHKLFAVEMAEHTRIFPIFLVPGNHDVCEESDFDLKDFRQLYGPEQFSFVVGRYLFVFLNDVWPYNQTGQYLEFLEQAVSSRAEKAEKIFVFMHIPPSGLNSSLMCKELPGSEKFLNLAKEYKIDYVFAGDHHGYGKTKRDGTTFVVTGGGGAKLCGKHGGFHHLVRMAVKDGSITETVIAARRHLETSELIERNIAFYFWPLLIRNAVSVAITVVVFGVAVWLLIFSLRRRKKFKEPLCSSSRAETLA